MNFRFLHAADIHLDSPMQGLRSWHGDIPEELTQVTRQALHNMVSLALDENVDFVLISGDLYDGDWNDYTTGLVFVKEMARLDRAEIPVFLIRGNHDARSEITSGLDLPGNCHEMASDRPETAKLDTIGVAVHGQSFATRAVHEDLTRYYPPALAGYFNIGLLHTSATGRELHEPYAPCSEAGLRTFGYSYWALGHVHQREILSQDPWIVFPGNLQGRHIRESGAKGCSLVTVEDGQINDVEHRPVDVLRFVTLSVDVEAMDSIDQLPSLVQEQLRHALAENDGRLLAVRLHVVGRTTCHDALLRDLQYVQAECLAAAETVGGERIFLEKIRVETRPWQAREVPEGAENFLDEILALKEELFRDEEARAAFQEQFSVLEKLFASTPPLREMFQQSFHGEEAQKRILQEAEAMIRSLLLHSGGDS